MLGSILTGLATEYALSNMVDKIFGKKNFKNMDNKERKVYADNIIRNHMVWSMGAGFIPVPVADVIAVSAIQLDMIRQISKIYDVEFKESQGKAIITALTGSTVARLSANALKVVPGIGTILGGVTMSVLSGASTYALGEVFKRHFASGGNLLNFDPAKMKSFYKEKFKKGKEVAEELKKEEEVVKSNASDINYKPSNLTEKLNELFELKEKGVITDEEFVKLKERIISE